MEQAVTLGKFHENMNDESKQRLQLVYVVGPLILAIGAVFAYRFRKPRP
jgi:hypothetical protein